MAVPAEFQVLASKSSQDGKKNETRAGYHRRGAATAPYFFKLAFGFPFPRGPRRLHVCATAQSARWLSVTQRKIAQQVPEMQSPFILLSNFMSQIGHFEQI